ncbi:hypothetical protein BT69DRAFT_1279880 [Atractiella rhizophila]|nr:hypothetical protein BT69DRAFT_1279880 [Atractiella rhizophila]
MSFPPSFTLTSRPPPPSSDQPSCQESRNILNKMVNIFFHPRHEVNIVVEDVSPPLYTEERSTDDDTGSLVPLEPSQRRRSSHPWAGLSAFPFKSSPSSSTATRTHRRTLSNEERRSLESFRFPPPSASQPSIAAQDEVGERRSSIAVEEESVLAVEELPLRGEKQGSLKTSRKAKRASSSAPLGSLDVNSVRRRRKGTVSV